MTAAEEGTRGVDADRPAAAGAFLLKGLTSEGPTVRLQYRLNQLSLCK